MTQVATSLVEDGSVRLEASATEPYHTLVLRPCDGGGLLLKNATTGSWDMHEVTMAALPTADVYDCTIDGVANQRVKRFTDVKLGQLNGPYSVGDVSVNMILGSASFTGTTNPTPRFASSWSPRYNRGDSLGEKLYFEVTVTPGANLMGIGLVAETQAQPLPPFNIQGTMGPGIWGCYWYFSNATDNGVYTNYLQNPAITAYIGHPTDGQVLAVACDFVNMKVWFRNVSAGGNWNNDATQNPATNAGGFSISNFQGKRMIPAVGSWGNNSATFNLKCVFPFSAAGIIPVGFAAGWGIPKGKQYDVFASDNGSGGVNLELVSVSSVLPYTSNIAIDSDTGFLIKGGDATRRLVGRCGVIPDSNEAGFNISGDYSKHSMVCSVFKRQKRTLGVVYTNGQILAPYNNVGSATMLNTDNDAGHEIHWVGFGSADPGFNSAGGQITGYFVPDVWSNAGMYNASGYTSACFIQTAIDGNYVSSPFYANSGKLDMWGSSSSGCNAMAEIHCASGQSLIDDPTQSHRASPCFQPFAPTGGTLNFEGGVFAYIWE